MSVRTTIVTSAALIAVLAASVGIGASAGVGPLAGHRPGAAPSAAAPAFFAPGASVTQNADGTTSVVGRLTAAETASRAHAYALLDSGPQSLTCNGRGPGLTCAPVADAGVVDALRAGATIYERTVHAGITDRSVASAVPFFAADELVCTESANATFACRAAADKQPTLPAGATEIATYRRLHVTFENGRMVERPLNPTVTLAGP